MADDDYHPDWYKVMEGCGGARKDANNLVMITRETARLAASAIAAQQRTDAYHNFAAAFRELTGVLEAWDKATYTWIGDDCMPGWQRVGRIDTADPADITSARDRGLRIGPVYNADMADIYEYTAPRCHSNPGGG